jgi:hypothetical protein
VVTNELLYDGKKREIIYRFIDFMKSNDTSEKLSNPMASVNRLFARLYSPSAFRQSSDNLKTSNRLLNADLG